MRLSRIYVAQPLTPGNSLQLDPAANHYVQHVLRLKAGAEIVLFNADDCYDYVSLIVVPGQTGYSLDSVSRLIRYRI